jgi:hypothetical protein
LKSSKQFFRHGSTKRWRESSPWVRLLFFFESLQWCQNYIVIVMELPTLVGVVVAIPWNDGSQAVASVPMRGAAWVSPHSPCMHQTLVSACFPDCRTYGRLSGKKQSCIYRDMLPHNDQSVR